MKMPQMIESEKFKSILEDEYPNCYEVSNFGRVKLIRSNTITIGYKSIYGYRYITSKYKGKRQTLLIHRLVAKAFHPNYENKPDVNHLDGNKENNYYLNLAWCTKSENMKHAVEFGLATNSSQRGELHNTAKKSNAQVKQIRQLYQTGSYTMRRLATLFNTSSGYVSDIVNFKIRIT